jgi:hypothetical protein
MRAHCLTIGRELQRAPANSRHRRGGRRWRYALAAPLLVSVSLGAQHSDTSWRDIESRIQYGYYTEDGPALRNLADTVAADETRDRLHGYYAGLLAWRLTLLAVQSPGAVRGASAALLAQRCVGTLDVLLEQQSDFADALALRAACLATPLDVNGTQASSPRQARKDFRRALQLAPGNPRVLLLDAMSDYLLPPTLGGNRERALVKLRQTVAAFEAERQDTEHLPGWGAAEAYLYLARDLIDHADPVAARDALEHALLIAPEFAQARQLMAKILTG